MSTFEMGAWTWGAFGVAFLAVAVARMARSARDALGVNGIQLPYRDGRLDLLGLQASMPTGITLERGDWCGLAAGTPRAGVVFLHVDWSGPSLLALKVLVQALRRRGPAELVIRIVELDSLPDTYPIHRMLSDLEINAPPAGWGETFVFSEGRVVCSVLRPDRTGAVRLGRALAEVG